MTEKKPKNPTNQQLFAEIKSVQGMIGNQGKTLKNHDKRLFDLEEHNKGEAIAKKAAKEAVDEYKKSEKANATGAPDAQWLTKELITVILKLIAVIAALVALVKFGGTIK